MRKLGKWLGRLLALCLALSSLSGLAACGTVKDDESHNKPPVVIPPDDDKDDDLDGDLHIVRFEAEDSILGSEEYAIDQPSDGHGGIFRTNNDRGTLNDRYSEGKWVSGVTNGTSMTYDIVSSKTGKVDLYFSAATCIMTGTEIEQYLNVRVNGMYMSEMGTFGVESSDDMWQPGGRWKIGSIELEEGENEIYFVSNAPGDGNAFNFDYIELECDKETKLSWVEGRFDKVYERSGKSVYYNASAAKNIDPSLVLEDVVGTRKGKALTGLDRSGQAFEFTVEAEKDMDVTMYVSVGFFYSYELAFVEALEVSLTNSEVQNKKIHSTAKGEGMVGCPYEAFDNFAEIPVAVVSLKQGKNTIKFFRRNAQVKTSFDYMRLQYDEAGEDVDIEAEAPLKKPYKAEAEDLYCNGNKNFGGDDSVWVWESGKVSGGKFLSQFENYDDKYIEIKVNAFSDCTVTLFVQAVLGDRLNTDEKFRVNVNGTNVAFGKTLESQNGYEWDNMDEFYWAVYELGDVQLKKGENTIRITFLNARIKLDYFRLDSLTELTFHLPDKS